MVEVGHILHPCVATHHINSPLTCGHCKHQSCALLSRLPDSPAGMEKKTHSYTPFNTPSGPQLQHVMEKQLFSTGPVGRLSPRLLMTSIWGNHRFPVALIKSRLIKTFAIHPMLTVQLVFFSLRLFICCLSSLSWRLITEETSSSPVANSTTS